MRKVSVIIPNYNHASYLKQRIESVLNQSYQDFELIILDDCSTDTSKDVIECFRGHEKVSQIVYNDQNGGTTFKQWNKGVALAKGDIVWIAESDDSASPYFLERLVSILTSRPDVGFAYANSYFIDEVGTILKTYSEDYAYWSNRWQKDYINDGREEVVHYLRFAPVILNVSSCIFRKELFEQCGGCDDRFRLAGDWMTYVKLLPLTKIAYTVEVLNFFRKHQQTVRSTSNQFVLFSETLKVIRYIYENFAISADQKKAQVYSLLANLLKFYKELSGTQKKTIFEDLRAIEPSVYFFWFKLNASLFTRNLFSKKNTIKC